MAKKIYLHLFAIMIIAGCRDESVRISGTLTNAPRGKYIYLDELMSNNMRTVDSAKISSDGTFSFGRDIRYPAFYLLKVNDRNFMTMLLTPGEKIELNSHYDSLNYATSVTGSEGTQQINDYNRKLRSIINKLSELSDIYKQNEGSPRLPSVIESLDSISQVYLDDINHYTKNYIDKNLTSLVSLIALYQQVAPNVYVLNPSKDYKYYMKVDSALTLLYSDYEPVKTLHEQVKELLRGVELSEGKSALAAEGSEAPEIIMPSPEGDTIKLSSTRGSVVLLDFWASWCAPCRQENPNLVKAYNQYHRSGFQIYQVSLDKTREAWVKGIEDDQLGKWIHVSDIQYWNSKAVHLYKIESIPSNFLLDKEGRIIASNLRGDALQRKLAEIFKQ